MDWLREHPDVKTIRVAAADLNGVPRGKRMPARFADKLLHEGTKFPYSVLNMDIWGEDIENSPLVFQAGDPDELQQIGLARFPGSLRRGEVAARYAEHAGLSPSLFAGQVVYYYVFGLFKVAVIAQQIYYRYRKGHTTDTRFARLDAVVAACAQMAEHAMMDGTLEAAN